MGSSKRKHEDEAVDVKRGKGEKGEKKEKKEKKERKEKKEKSEKIEKKQKKENKEKKEKSDKKDKKEKREKKDKKESKIEDNGKLQDQEETKITGSSTLSSPAAYRQSDELSAVPQSEVDQFLETNEVTVEDPSSRGFRPILAFSQVQLQSKIAPVVTKFPKPTPIQSASWPYLLNGDDVVGVAETGSGKTFAFGVPAINNIISANKKGLRVLCISPTRELALQIYDNLTTLTDKCGLLCVAVYGGVPKDQQIRAVKSASVVVATPGRLVDLLNDEAVDLSSIDYLVLDEADRMLEKGFEEDIKRIIGCTNSLRQTLMFTATWPKEVRELAATFMRLAVKVSIGNRDELAANKRITQTVEVMDPRYKERRLLQLLRQYGDQKILVFALYKKEATRVEGLLRRLGFNVAAIHGDLSQQQRTAALDAFKRGESNLLLATDVAARGLDIPNVKVVINLTFPLTVEDYVHRIGRTGRAGQTGTAYTLFTEHEKHLSGALMNVLRGAGQPVPDELLKFGGHTKKKSHLAYGAFFKDVDMTKTAKKIKFD